MMYEGYEVTYEKLGFLDSGLMSIDCMRVIF